MLEQRSSVPTEASVMQQQRWGIVTASAMVGAFCLAGAVQAGASETSEVDSVALERRQEPTNVKQWRALTSHARDLQHAGRHEDARDALRRALAALQRPGTHVDLRHLAAARSNYAEALRVGGSPAAAEALLEHAHTALTSDPECDRALLADTLVNRAAALSALGRSRCAAAKLRHAVNLNRIAHGEGSAPVARALLRLAELERKRRRFRAALRAAKEARSAFSDAGDSAHSLRCSATVALLLADLRRWQEFQEEVASLLAFAKNEPASERSLLRASAAACEQLSGSLQQHCRSKRCPQVRNAVRKLLSASESGWRSLEGELGVRRIRALTDLGVYEHDHSKRVRVLNEAHDASERRFAKSLQRFQQHQEEEVTSKDAFLSLDSARAFVTRLLGQELPAEKRKLASGEAAAASLAPCAGLLARSSRSLAENLRHTDPERARSTVENALAAVRHAKLLLLDCDPTLEASQRQLPHIVREQELCVQLLQRLA